MDVKYGASVKQKKIETLHLKFLKQTLRVRKTTPNCYVYKELNVLPLQIRRTFRIIKYWLKILSLDDSNPVKSLYNIAVELNVTENNTVSCYWAANVRDILFKNGFGYIWENQNYGISSNFFNVFKTRIVDSFWQNNQNDINSLSTNRLYRHLNSNGMFYLTKLPNNFIRIAVSKLRLGSHNFNIERGRWKKLDLVDRICLLCGDIEDEYHVVMCCKKYDDLRKKYIPRSIYQNPSMFKFVNYLNCENVTNIKNLGLFIHFVYARYDKEENFLHNLHCFNHQFHNVYESLQNKMTKIYQQFYIQNIYMSYKNGYKSLISVRNTVNGHIFMFIRY